MCNSVFVHWWFTRKQRGCLGVGESFPITHSQLSHKVAATLVLVRGSICLILETEGKRKCSFNLRNKTPDWYGLCLHGYKLELTPLVAHQHRTCCVSSAVVSFPIGKQVVPEHCSALRQESNMWLLQLKSDTLSFNNKTVNGYLLGPYRCTNIWEYCSAPCCHITHLQQRQSDRKLNFLTTFKRTFISLQDKFSNSD